MGVSEGHSLDLEFSPCLRSQVGSVDLPQPPGQAASPGNKTSRELQRPCLETGSLNSNSGKLALQKQQGGSSKRKARQRGNPLRAQEGSSATLSSTPKGKEGSSYLQLSTVHDQLCSPDPVKNDSEESKKV